MQYVFWGPHINGPNYTMIREILELSNVTWIKMNHALTPYIIKKVAMKFPQLRSIITHYIDYLARSVNNIDKSVVFIYFEPWYMLFEEINYISFLKKKYKNSFHVCMLSDCVVANILPLDKLKKTFDKIYIYDEYESRKLGIDYMPPAYSKNYATPIFDEETFDVCYVGQARNRLKDIISAYDKLTNLGLSCRFYVVDVQKRDRIIRDGIKYGKRYLNGDEYFYSYIKPARCMLEIANPETNALTARVREAMMYEKKIITNNPNIVYSNYYNPDMVRVLSEDINISFIRNNGNKWHYNNDFSPFKILERLRKDYSELRKIKRAL